MMKKKLLVLYLVIIHLLLVVILFKTDVVSQLQIRLGLSDPQELTRNYHELLAFHKRMDANLLKGSVVFIGDSITQGLAVSAVSPLSVNYGIGNDTTVGVLNRIGEYRALNSAKAVVLAVGVNDLKRRDSVEILENYTSILDKIPLGVKVIICAVKPVDGRIRQASGRTLQRIDLLNIGLKQLSDRLPNAQFLTVNDKLVDNTGNLAKEYHIGDGVHLSAAGYEVWIKELRQVISKLDKV